MVSFSRRFSNKVYYDSGWSHRRYIDYIADIFQILDPSIFKIITK
jgi:hypothetical protein